jgi:hypothetical protein
MISKFILPQATLCAAVEKWLRSLEDAPYKTAQVHSVKVKSVMHGTFQAIVETRIKPKHGPPAVQRPADMIAED